METQRTARIAVVIVTYNSAAVLEACLQSVAAQVGAAVTAVVVADNNSADDSVALAQRQPESPPVRVVQLGRNAGYAAGINAAIASLDLDAVDAVMVLNPDCRLHPQTLATLARALEPAGRGIAVPRLTDLAGHQHHSLRRAPTVRGAFAEAVLGGHRAGRAGGRGEMITDPAAYASAGPAAWATGAAMLIATETITKVGDWDESFFLYSEETEYALRAADHGFTLWYEPAAIVEHIGGESKTNTTLAALLVVNKVRLFQRRNGAPASVAYYVATALGQGVRALAGSRAARASFVALIRPGRSPHPQARPPETRPPGGVGVTDAA